MDLLGYIEQYKLDENAKCFTSFLDNYEITLAEDGPEKYEALNKLQAQRKIWDTIISEE